MDKKKYIHYCWFGGKPLPKLAQKCLASWKKYFPDYEIIRWDESNCDFNECEFVKKAYETKYYAFVADYVRTKAMYEMGGIYFDTDMEVIKDPKELIKKYDSFLGVEDTGKVCCGVWYEKSPHSFLASELLKRYRSFKDIDFEKRNEFSIPLLITEILEPCGFDYKKRRIQTLEHNITVFPRDYFYPFSYNRNNNLFSDNTYMIHYYDASWLPIKNRIENYLVRRYGRIRALNMIKAYQKAGLAVRLSAKGVLYPVVIYRRIHKKKELIDDRYLERIEKTISTIRRERKSPYLVLHNSDWLGVTSATKELFSHTVDCGELLRKKDVRRIGEEIRKTEIKQIVFSAMAYGWPELIRVLHRDAPFIKQKVFWHGSMSQVLDKYGWKMHKATMNLCRRGYISAFATCKQSLYNFYKSQGIPAIFITNKVRKQAKSIKEKKRNDDLRIGLYAASPDNWRKNVFSQIAAVSLLKDAILDVVPMNEIVVEFARSVGVTITGESNNISRNALMKRMADNDVNLYVTFSECSPMLPLESLEVGVPCITGNNHHYFKGNGLEAYLVVSQEESPEAIKNQIINCVKNRKAILDEYAKVRESNIKQANEDVTKFLEVGLNA